MKSCVCPHCGKQRIVTARIPRDLVVVLPCPSCHELVVLFRNKVVGLNRAIIERGSFEERKLHIAGVIAEFLEPGMLPFGAEASEAEANALPGAPDAGKGEPDAPLPPITQREIDRFVKIDLKRLDEPEYFKKFFG